MNKLLAPAKQYRKRKYQTIDRKDANKKTFKIEQIPPAKLTIFWSEQECANLSLQYLTK